MNLAIAEPRVTEFDAWLGDHVDEMLDLPGFVDATVFDQSDESDTGLAKRSVHYRLEDRAALERYFAEHAQRMRAEGVERFGEDMTATRRVLTQHRDGEACANCQTLLAGQYCAACGQRHRTRMISLWELLRDVFEDAFSWDSRVWRSLRPLLFQPGKLTSEYLDGRRMYYTPPLRMYLVLSIAFFLLSTLPALEGFNAAKMLRVDASPDDFELRFGPDAPPLVSASTSSDLELSLDAGPDGKPELAITTDADEDTDEDADANADEDSDDDDFECDFSDATINVPGVSDEVVRQRMTVACRAIKTTEGRARMVENFADLLPRLLIIMLPLIALAGKIAYPLSRRYYVEHLLFYTHYHSFLFLLLIVTMCVTAATGRVSALAPLTGAFSIGVGVYALYYLYRALRRVFGQGRKMTLYKMFLIWMAYFFAAIVFSLVGVIIAILSV
ncbi:MAG: DUF4286 family protein [Gammaproteobacteria bacterium]